MKPWELRSLNRLETLYKLELLVYLSTFQLSWLGALGSARDESIQPDHFPDAIIHYQDTSVLWPRVHDWKLHK